jgi:hypothetical protein
MVIRAGVVLTEPSVDQGVIGRLVVDPQEEELLRLQVGLDVMVPLRPSLLTCIVSRLLLWSNVPVDVQL